MLFRSQVGGAIAVNDPELFKKNPDPVEGINATLPVASDLILRPPISIVLPLKYKLRKRCVGLPKS